MEAERPDVVLTDIRMPPSGDDEGITVANRLRETHPDVGVVVVSQYANPRYGVALLEGGSERRAYLLKERLYDRAQLVGALTTVAEGGSVVDSKVVEALIAAQVRTTDSPLARAHARASWRSSPRSPRARATARSRISSCCPSAPSRSTSTRSS